MLWIKNAGGMIVRDNCSTQLIVVCILVHIGAVRCFKIGRVVNASKRYELSDHTH